MKYSKLILFGSACLFCTCEVHTRKRTGTRGRDVTQNCLRCALLDSKFCELVCTRAALVCKLVHKTFVRAHTCTVSSHITPTRDSAFSYYSKSISITAGEVHCQMVYHPTYSPAHCVSSSNNIWSNSDSDVGSPPSEWCAMVAWTIEACQKQEPCCTTTIKSFKSHT